MFGRILKNSSGERTKRANVNILISLFFKGGSILLSFLLIPLTIRYIKSDSYGVWLTLSSLVGWIAIFDIGIGNGLKNKLSESLTKGDYKTSKVYVSTTYAVITLIAIVLIASYLIISPLVNWQNVFNTDFISVKELNLVVTVVALSFFLKFIVDIINIVAACFQMVSVSSILLFISNLFLTIAVYILTKTTEANLVFLALCLSLIPVLVSVIASIYLFKRQFKLVTPSLKAIDFKESKSIMTLGSQFFILQIIALVIFQTDNILIAQLFQPSDVTNFNISYRYFGLITMIFTIVLTPYWTAFTEAYNKKEFDWIQKTIRTLIRYWFVSIGILILMILFAGILIKLWVGTSVLVSFPLSISISLYIIILNWNAIFANFLNGIGKIRMQILLAIIAGIVNIPLCFLLVKYFKMGLYAMPISNVLSLSLGAFFGYYQYLKIIRNRATGIWNK
jgi:O-antigen/teichoic acid export membrane protein